MKMITENCLSREHHMFRYIFFVLISFSFLLFGCSRNGEKDYGQVTHLNKNNFSEDIYKPLVITDISVSENSKYQSEILYLDIPEHIQLDYI